jgi:hypothetical protein
VSTERDPVFGCILVTSKLDKDGYAYHGRSRAHIVAFVEHYGLVPPEHEVDHMCRRRNCRAWWHLEAVTRSENELRKSWRYRVRRAKCPRGHDLNLHRVVTPEKGIVCRACNRKHQGAA